MVRSRASTDGAREGDAAGAQDGDTGNRRDDNPLPLGWLSMPAAVRLTRFAVPTGHDAIISRASAESSPRPADGWLFQTVAS